MELYKYTGSVAVLTVRFGKAETITLYDSYDGMGCSGQFFTTRVRLFRRRGCWYAYHFVSVDM